MEYSEFAGLEETKAFESQTFGSDFRALCTVLIKWSLCVMCELRMLFCVSLVNPANDSDVIKEYSRCFEY